jgi:hypothetical protein
MRSCVADYVISGVDVSLAKVLYAYSEAIEVGQLKSRAGKYRED